MKPFLTLDEQIDRLKTRKLHIDDVESAKIILSKENYYNLVNGYKKPFLKRDLTGGILDPEEYVEDCKFEELHKLYLYDRDLRLFLLGVLLKFETHFKTSCAYNFSNEYRETYAYLNIGNYSKEKEDFTTVLRNISGLSSELNKNTKWKNAKSIYISHYIENHEYVPLWVLVNSLTIGNMSYFYSAVNKTVKEKIAKEFSINYKKEYTSTEKVDVGELKEIIKAVNLFRNVCAHEEVLFLFCIKRKIKGSLFTKYYKTDIFTQDKLKRSDLFSLVSILKLVMEKDEYIEFIEELDKLFNKYQGLFSSIKFEDIILLSGFHSGWKKDIIDSL